LEISLESIPVVFAKVRGKKGVRELKAIISPSSKYSVITNKDALQMGYDVIARRGGVSAALAVTASGIIKGSMVKIDEISVADCTAKNVDSLCYELPEAAGADLILGQTFLDNFYLTFDYKKKVLQLMPPQEGS
jgi:predicted aspartyl protease